MEYRIASEKDIEQLIQSRMDTLRDVNHLGAGYEFSDEFLNASRAYFLEGDQTTVLATDGDMTAGCATMCYLQLMPTYSHPSGKHDRGLCHNVLSAADADVFPPFGKTGAPDECAYGSGPAEGRDRRTNGLHTD